MREDAIGLFWADIPKTRGGGPRQWGAMPEIPQTGWRPPAEFPNLSAAKVIGLDTETYDPEMGDAGPGWGRGVGHIVGVSLAVEDGTSWYFPIRHEVQPEQNLDPQAVLNYLRHTLGDNRPKVGANILYDIGWLQWEGVSVGGPLYDVQYAEALLNSEAPRVALEDLAQTYLGAGKVTDYLYEWLHRWNGRPANDKQRKWIYKTPPSLAGPYAESDAALPIRILEQQWPKLAEANLLDLFHMECKLIRVLVAMRMRGSPVNIARAEQVYDELGDKLAAVQAKMKDIAGQEVNPNAAKSMESAFTRLGLQVPTIVDKKTGNERVSFAAPVLESIEHPIADLVLEHRKLEKIRNTFVKSYIIDKNVNGRLYTSFHQLRGSGHGTRSGRLSSSDPNLQNVPVRSEEGKLVRSMFDAAMNGGRWRSYDYSSIEYRLLAHHAVGGGSDHVRQILVNDPAADYHAIVGDLIRERTGLSLPRTDIKRVNFGLVYGMQLPALARTLGLSRQKAKSLLDDYHDAAPYVKATMNSCVEEVHRFGYVTTIAGRRSQFPYWGPKRAYCEEKFYGQGFPYNVARSKWGVGNIERQHTHKALNRKLQGGAADVMKTAMVRAYEDGLFAPDACGIPCLTVHDELDFEDYGDPDNPAWDELKRIMETATAGLRVPLLVEGGVGPTWAEAH